MHDNDHTGRTDGGGHDIELVQHVVFIQSEGEWVYLYTPLYKY